MTTILTAVTVLLLTFGTTIQDDSLSASKRAITLSTSLQIMRNLSQSCSSLEMAYRKIDLSDEDKIQWLNSNGGSFLSDYMALDVEQAKQKFRNLLAASQYHLVPTPGDDSMDPQRDHLRTKFALIQDLQIFFRGLSNSTKVDDSKRTRRRVVRSSMTDKDRFLSKFLSGVNKSRTFEKKNVPKTTQSTYKSVPTTFVPPAEAGVRNTRIVSSEGYSTVVEYCIKRGTAGNDGYLHMCTTCAATTTLPEDRFPRVINEAICSPDDTHCLTVHGTHHGRCAQKIFNLNMLRRKQGICTVALQNGEKVVVDDWELYTQPIRVCCECTIDQRSFFAQYVPRDGDENGDNVEPRKNAKGGSGKS